MMYELTTFSPLEVVRFTIEEIFEILEGAKRREARRTRTMAYWVANLMNATGNYHKSPMTPDKLLGKPTDRELMKKRAESRKRTEGAANRNSR